MTASNNQSRQRRTAALLSHGMWPRSGRQLARRGASLRGSLKPDYLPQRGNAFTRWLAWTVLRLHGWDVRGVWPSHRYTIAVVAPHTCNYDAWLAMWMQFALGFKFSFFIKKEIFQWYWSGFIRYLGGIPVDRKKPAGIIEVVRQQFKIQNSFVLGITPEATRHPPKRLRFGAWHLSQELDIPIVPVTWDFDTRTIWVEEPFDSVDSFEEWELQLYRYFDGIRGGTGYFMGEVGPNGRRLPDVECPRPLTPGNAPVVKE